MTVQKSHAHIDCKYAFNIRMLTEDVNLFWSKRNIQKLSTFYTLWAQDLIKHQFDPFGVLEQFYQTLEGLLNPPTGEKSKVPERKGEHSSDDLLTRVELQSVIQSYKTNLAHKVALATLQVSSGSEGLETEMQSHSAKIQESYKVLNSNTNRVVEKSLQFSEIDLEIQEKITLIDYEIDSLLIEFERASKGTNELLFDFVVGKKVPFKFKQPLIVRLSNLYLKKIAILKSLGLTTMSAHLDWATSMIGIRSKFESRVVGIETSDKKHVKFVKAYREIAAKETQVVELAHTEFVEASGKYEPYNALISQRTQALFITSLKDAEILLYDFGRNQFIKVNLNQYLPDEGAVICALEQIVFVIRLLLNNSAEMIDIAKKALGPLYTLSNAIVTLFNKMYKIQKMYLTHKGKVIRITEKFDKEIQETIRNHIRQAYQLALLKSSEGPIQVKDFFAPGLKSHFYLKLALDLKIHTGVKPKEMPDLVFLELIEHVQVEKSYEKEDAYLDAFALNRSQKCALKYYREIRELEYKSKVSEDLTKTAEEVKAYKITNLVRIFENQDYAEEFVDELMKAVDLKEPDKFNEMSDTRVKQIASAYLELLNLDAFCKKYSEALFYMDLLVRLGNGSWSFQFDGKVVTLNPVHIYILEKITSHFRLVTLRVMPAARDMTALAQLVQPGDLKLASGEISIREANFQVAKRIRKTKEKFTEILIHGLRSYHSMLSTLTAFLDWKPAQLIMMFENYLIKEHLKKQTKSKKKVSNLEVRKFRRQQLRKVPSISKKAGLLAERFVDYLQPYRTLQLYMLQFYNGLGNIVFQDPDYMQLNPLTEDDIIFLESKMDEVKIGYFNDVDEKTALFLKPHIQDLRELIKKTPASQQAKAVNRFLQTRMLHEDHPPLNKGLPLHLAGVSYMSIKLLIRTILIIEKGKSIQGINLDLFNQLFESQSSPWTKFSDATSRGVGQKVENELGKFIKAPLESAPPLGFYYDLEPQEDEHWEYFQVRQPFLMMTPIITVQNKWNSYLNELRELLDGLQFQASFRAIQQAAISLNDSERMRSRLSMERGSSSKRRDVVTIFSTAEE